MSTTDFAAAIDSIQHLGAAAAKRERFELVAHDGKETKSVPVCVVTGADGALRVVSFASHVQEASEVLRKLRLAQEDGPDHRQGVAELQAITSFIDHANRFKGENSAVWADAARRRLVSVLDYHPAGANSPARWGRHRGVYDCPLSEAWRAWGGEEGLELSQDDFAELLDSRDRDLVEGKLPSGMPAPSPSALVTMAANLEVYSEAKAKRSRDKYNRVSLSYSEEKGVAGEVQPPQAFLVAIPVFQDSARQVLEVRLRVTVEEGKAKFHVRLHAAGEVWREAFLGLCRQVEEATKLPVFIGTPE